MRHAPRWPLALIVLLAAAFTLACRLTVNHAADGANDASDAVIDNLLGGSRLLLGDVCFERADNYLHRGSEHVHKQAFTNRWFQRLEAVVSPRTVAHREGTAGINDLLPWVTLAAELAPTNTDFTLTQAYLLQRLGQEDRALGLLLEARRRLPDRAEIPLEEARLHLARQRWQAGSRLLDKARQTAAAAPDVGDNTAAWAEASMLRGLLHERAGETNDAMIGYACAARLDARLYGDFSNRVARLALGQTPAPPADAILDNLSRIHASRPLCAHDHEHGD